MPIGYLERVPTRRSKKEEDDEITIIIVVAARVYHHSFSSNNCPIIAPTPSQMLWNIIGQQRAEKKKVLKVDGVIQNI